MALQDTYTEDEEWGHMPGYRPRASPSMPPSGPDTATASVRLMTGHCVGNPSHLCCDGP